MTGALIYLQAQSVKNRLRFRLRRLKKPKYLIGAIAGAVYFYFFFFRNFAPSRRSVSTTISSESLLLFELLGALALFSFVLSAWIFPHERAALAFSEAEIAFLFPAPVTRRTLIHFKLLRSQLAILFTTLFLTVLTRRFGGGSSAWIRAAGWWAILSTLNLHTLAASFARTRLLEHGISNRQRRILVLSALALLAGAVFVWARQTIPAPGSSDFASFDAIKYYLRHALESGPAFYVLYPFRLIVRPFLATDGLAFLRAIAPALVVIGLHYAWVVRSDVAFEEASLDLSRKLAEKVAAVRSGRWPSSPNSRKRKRPPFTLRPDGIPAGAFLWKNLISAGQMFSLRTWLLLVVPMFGVTVFTGWRPTTGGWLLPTVGIVALVLTGYSLLLGPVIMRQDLRQDLPNADILRTYPLSGWQVVSGELLTPALILTAIQWGLILLAVGSFSSVPGGHNLPLTTRISIGFGAAIVAPTMNLISLVIPNAAALLFPSWTQLGRERGGGIEVMGQRLVFMAGSALVFVFALVPAAVLSALVFLAVKILSSAIVAIPVAAAAGACVLAGEASLGIWWLGRLFERFDLSAESTV